MISKEEYNCIFCLYISKPKATYAWEGRGEGKNKEEETWNGQRKERVEKY